MSTIIHVNINYLKLLQSYLHLTRCYIFDSTFPNFFQNQFKSHKTFHSNYIILSSVRKNCKNVWDLTVDANSACTKPYSAAVKRFTIVYKISVDLQLLKRCERHSLVSTNCTFTYRFGACVQMERTPSINHRPKWRLGDMSNCNLVSSSSLNDKKSCIRWFRRQKQTSINWQRC